MKKFKGYISLDLVGCTRTFDFEVEDDATDEEIEQIAREVAFDYIDWNYEPVKG